ncbi:hypothetical protein FOA52_009952 [Chlamydomonas sp. UWO 241]|nr:hypothetical protein FOA52_009952 [Chlamydomonas sp. UWO 241]
MQQRVISSARGASTSARPCAPPVSNRCVVARSAENSAPAAASGNGQQEKAMWGENFGARDATAGEIESNFGEKVLYNFDTMHVIKIPAGVKQFVGIGAKAIVAVGELVLVEGKTLDLLKNQVPGWRVVKTTEGHTALEQEWRAKDDASAPELASRLQSVQVEGSLEHNPLSVKIKGSAVIVTLSTSQVGGITENDFIVASRMNDKDVKELIADAGHGSDALAVVLAVVQAQTQQIASLVDLVHLLVSRVPGAPMQMPHAVPHAAHSAPRAAPAAKAAQPARPAAAAAPVASAAGAPAAERHAAAGAARAASARGPSRRGGLPARVGETSLCRSHVLSIPVAAATRLIAGRGSEGQMARDGIVRGALRDASYLGSTRHVRRLFSDCYGSEETAVAAAAVRVAAAAVDGVSLPVCLAMNLVRFVHDVSGRDRPAGGGVVSASFLNAKPAVGGIGVEPRRGGVLRVLFTVASDAVADTVVRSRRNLRDVDPSAAVFDVLSDREEAQHRALWPAFLAAKAAGKRAQFHRARLVVDGERVPAPAC